MTQYEKRIIRILKKEGSLPASMIFERLKNDSYKRHPRNINSLAQMLRGRFSKTFEKVNVTVKKTEWKIKDNVILEEEDKTMSFYHGSWFCNNCGYNSSNKQTVERHTQRENACERYRKKMEEV